MSKTHPDVASPPSFDEVFAALPPVGSPEYLERLRTASTQELPPEVLARAYRQLAGEDDEAARATLARLLGEKKGRPEYLGTVLWHATRRVPRHQHWQEALDLFQDAVALVIEVLPTERGRYAERAWRSFCYQRLIDAWRRRQGRRGERAESRRVEPAADEDAEALDPLDLAEDLPPWHAAVRPDKLPWLEELVGRVVAGVADPFVRAVAEDQWLSGDPSPISGARTSAGGRKPLTRRYGKSRFQVYRALNAARARLFAALATQNEVEVDLEALRTKWSASALE
jgi:hypothetical protein